MKRHLLIMYVLPIIMYSLIAAGTVNAQIFRAPRIGVSTWDCDTSRAIQITITDSSDCETGYRIYRELNFSSAFGLVCDTVIADPVMTGETIVWIDNAISYNTWYRYRVAVYNLNDSLFSDTSGAMFTFHYTLPTNVVRFQKLSDFTIAADSGGWSALNMNTVILKETAAPADSFTVIGVGNPAQPQRLGYIDSADARSLPVRTLIPVFINYGVSNAYGKRKVVNCINQTHIIIAQDTTVRMYRINGNSLVYVNSLRINGGFGNIHDLLPLNDTLLGIRTYNNEILFLAVSLSATAFPTVRDSIAYVGTFGWGDYKRYYMYHHRPYFHGIVNNNLYISTDYYYENYDWMRTPMYGHTYGHYLDVRNILFKKSNKITAMPYSDAFNTGNLLSQAKILCTNGFPFPFEIFSSYTFLPGNVSTEIFAADVGDQRPRATDSAFNAIYRDDVHKQNQLQNILLDTTNRRVYLMFNNNMTILGYQYQTVGVAGRAEKPVAARGIFVLSNAFSSGVTIVLPAGTASTPADLYFYDLAGRVVDKLLGVTSKAILWRPKTRTMSCYLVMAKIGGKKFTEKFMAR